METKTYHVRSTRQSIGIIEDLLGHIGAATVTPGSCAGEFIVTVTPRDAKRATYLAGHFTGWCADYDVIILD